MCRVERPVTADGARGQSDAGGADEATKRSVLLCSSDRGSDLFGVRDIRTDVRAADIPRDGLRPAVLQIQPGGVRTSARKARTDASPGPGAPPVTIDDLAVRSSMRNPLGRIELAAA